MDRTTNAPVELAIAHVLFIDIVSYSKLTTKEQNAAVATLNHLVQECEPFQAAEKANRLLKIPTGDGMALVFYSSPEEPVRCAVALTKALKQHRELQVRMGVHSGSVSGVVDVTGRANVAGAGINIAQRVMDCADAGHILLSKHAADDLAEYEQWRPMLHDLGTCEVKHGVSVHLVNLSTDAVGNPAVPSKLQAQKRQATKRRWVLLGSAAALVAITTAILLFRPGGGKSIIDRSVAVLPFENLGGKEENASFAGGVHREILLHLSKVSDLKVISRTSVMQYAAGTARNLKQIARELGVSHVVEGSVQRERDKVRVMAQLIDAATDTPIWAESYDRQLADVFTIQNEIAQRISDQLGAKLSPQERLALASTPTHDVEAFDLYTKARVLMDTDPDNFAYADNFRKAVALLEAAAKRDPQFVAAYSALSDANTQLYRDGRQNCEPAKAALKEAKRIAPDAGEAYFAEALIYYYCGRDYNRALATLELAARSLPNDSEIFTLRGLLERRLARWEESLRHFTRAIELNPKNPTPYGHGAGSAWALRRYDESRRILDAAIAAFPAEADSWRPWKGAMALAVDGDVEGARHQLQQIRIKDNKASLDLAFEVPMAERNYPEAEQALAAFANDKGSHRIDTAPAEASWGFATKRIEERRAVWSTMLAEAAEQIKKNPTGRTLDPELRGSALLNAALGNKQEAIDLAKRGVEFFPVSQDGVNGPLMLHALAVVYTWTGEKDLAFETLFVLAKTPGGHIHVGDLKLNPDWDNLRDDPRFNELLAEAAKPLK